MSYFFPILLTILGGLSYHVSSKNIPDINPLLVLSGAYIFQSIVCLALLPFFKTLGPISFIPTSWNFWVIGLAVGSILLELGFILAYKVGWDLSNADITSVAIVAILFIIVGALFFNEPFTVKRICGVAVCIVGLILVQ